MSAREGSMHTRRSFLGLAVGFLTAGCAPSVATTSGGVGTLASNCRGKGATKFPDDEPWGWNSNWTTNLDKLGKIIMQAQNPYCQVPGGTTLPGGDPTNCKADQPDTWPHQLTSEATWKVLTEFDFLPTNWVFQGTSRPIQKSMRIPYLITHTVAQHGKNKPNWGRENLLVGFGEDITVNINGAQAWDGPSTCSANQIEAVGQLAEFITINMMRITPKDTVGFYLSGWDGNIPSNTDTAGQWTFRQAQVKVQYPFRIPVAVGQPGAAQMGGWIYVGYEGGGAY
jgi:hypothetical protein